MIHHEDTKARRKDSFTLAIGHNEKRIRRVHAEESPQLAKKSMVSRTPASTWAKRWLNRATYFSLV